MAATSIAMYEVEDREMAEFPMIQEPGDGAPETGQQALDSLASLVDSLRTALAEPSLHIELWLPHMFLLLLVLVGLPVLAVVVRSKSSDNDPPLKGLSLPEGSVRSMLALLIAGSLLLTVIFGPKALTVAYDKVISILAALAGSVLGFYFGSRGSQGKSAKPKEQ